MTGMEKHTPGPWITASTSLQGAYALLCGCSIVREYRSFRGDSQERYGIRWCPTHAAAPDLLAALEYALPAIAVPKAFEQARAAIRKARGEA